MRAWTGTRVPAKTGVPLRISGDEVTIGSAMALPYSRSFLRLKGAERARSAAGASNASTGPLRRVVRRFPSRVAALLLYAIAKNELADADGICLTRHGRIRVCPDLAGVRIQEDRMSNVGHPHIPAGRAHYDRCCGTGSVRRRAGEDECCDGESHRRRATEGQACD